jgi:hypothetical protein
MNRPVAVVAILTTFACVLQGQGTLTGTWEGETRGGSSIVLTLVVKETALTGTLVRNGQSAKISDGRVSGNTFTFTAILNDQKEGLSGELAGDDIRIWLDRQGSSTAIVLRRAKGK